MQPIYRVCPLCLLLGLVLLASSSAGCSSGPKPRPTGEVKGQVTFQKKPVTEGTVTFVNTTEGGSAEAKIQDDGSYVMESPVPVGDYLVVITPLIHIVDTDPGKSPPAPVEKAAPNIPPKYRMEGTTPFKVKVEEGKNTIDLPMTR